MGQSRKFILIGIGWVFVILGTIGTVLPLIPTTPLFILAAFCFSKGSDRLHEWLINRPVFGPLIVEWEKHGVIRPKAKILSTTMIILLFSISLFVAKVHLVIKMVLVLIGCGVLIFIWSRPSAPSHPHP